MTRRRTYSTTNEEAIIALLREGLTTKEIAEKLDLSQQMLRITVSTLNLLERAKELGPIQVYVVPANNPWGRVNSPCAYSN